MVMHPKYADRIANSVDPDQTASYILLDLFVQKLRILTVLNTYSYSLCTYGVIPKRDVDKIMVGLMI